MEFRDDFINPIYEGKKVCTTRMGKQADCNDVLNVSFFKILITGVVKLKLADAIEIYYISEGFDTMQEFYNCIISLYPKVTLDDYVYVHKFQVIT